MGIFFIQEDCGVARSTKPTKPVPAGPHASGVSSRSQLGTNNRMASTENSNNSLDSSTRTNRAKNRGTDAVSPKLKVKTKKKIRHGRRKSFKISSFNNDDNCFSIVYSNIRGFNSKKISLNNIINKLNPSVLTLNEVGFKNNKKPL